MVDLNRASMRNSHSSSRTISSAQEIEIMALAHLVDGNVMLKQQRHPINLERV
jgi:hypothetical protein